MPRSIICLYYFLEYSAVRPLRLLFRSRALRSAKRRAIQQQTTFRTTPFLSVCQKLEAQSIGRSGRTSACIAYIHRARHVQVPLFNAVLSMWEWAVGWEGNKVDDMVSEEESDAVCSGDVWYQRLCKEFGVVLLLVWTVLLSSEDCMWVWGGVREWGV